MQVGFPKGINWRMDGAGGFVNFNGNRHIGLDAHARFLNFHDWYGQTKQHYLAGPRYTFLSSNRWHPYASFQIALIREHYPFTLGNANFLALAPGGGLDYHVGHRWELRASYEYQFPPNFSNEPKSGIHPNGFQTGVAYRIH
jgi:opacity protein-like surface antigen